MSETNRNIDHMLFFGLLEDNDSPNKEALTKVILDKATEFGYIPAFSGYYDTILAIVEYMKETEQVDKLINDKIKEIMSSREKILEAFIAETGLLPSECEQVVEGNSWYVRKRENND